MMVVMKLVNNYSYSGSDEQIIINYVISTHKHVTFEIISDKNKMPKS